MDHREAIDICRGRIVEGEAGKALARRRGDDPQPDPDIRGRLELVITPGEIAVGIAHRPGNTLAFRWATRMIIYRSIEVNFAWGTNE